jgi:phospholipase D1/2
LVGDTFRKFRKSEGVGSFLSKVSGVVDKVNERIEGRLSPKRTSAQFNPTSVSQQGTHRFESFAAPCSGNDVKWYVDGASYFWAVSVALERARESVWILDCMCSVLQFPP